MKKVNQSQIDDLLTRNIEDIIVKKDLEVKLKAGKKLRIKLGFDPTGPRIHIGRAVTLWKLRQFQDMGHHIMFVIGDFTAQIGDSSDKDSERKMLSIKEVKENFKDYHKQLSMILDMSKVELFYNGSWYNKMPLEKFFQLAKLFTIQQMTERENFAKRIKSNKPVGMHETLYPMFQGYDSVEMKADLEVGGTDQLFNMLAGRDIQKSFGMEPQSVMTFRLLEGTDGRKMSTSWGNCIYINEKPTEMFGKIMSIHDELIISYFKGCTDLTLAQITQIEADLAGGDNPRDTKASLAHHVVARYHGEEVALKAQDSWNKQFRDKEKPQEIPTMKLHSGTVLEVVSKLFQLSKSDVRRLVVQKGIKIDDKVVEYIDQKINSDCLIQVGKRRYIKLVVVKNS